MRILARLIPVLLSAALLLGANGMGQTLLALRADIEGFSDVVIGLTGAAYFLGFMIACVMTPVMIARSGHIRVFAALSTLAASSSLVPVLVVDPTAWIASRFVVGVCFAGISMVLESWLNSASETADRGRVLSLYRIVDLGAVTGFQFFVPAIGPETFQVFAVLSVLFCLAPVPICLSTLKSPAPPERTTLRPRFVYDLSPVATMGIVTIGLTNGAFRTVGPIYASSIGLTVDGVAIFMSVAIAAGAVLQYPLGWLSDRTGRRRVLIVATIGAAIAGSLLAGSDVPMTYVWIALFGGMSLPLYSLSIAHANDLAAEGQWVDVAAGLIFYYSIAAALGSTAVAVLIEIAGPSYFFVYTSILHAGFVAVILYRMSRRADIPRAMRRRFMGLLRTSPQLTAMARSAPQSETGKAPPPSRSSSVPH